MELQVTLYKSTGFNEIDRPSNPDVLENFESVVYPSNIFDWQHYDKPSIRIRTTWQLVADVDYVKLHATDTESYDTYFTVSRVSMLNVNTAELYLQLDGLMSCGGIGNCRIISGWAQRAHVSSDHVFTNTLDEPWVPSEELIIEGTQEYQRVSTAENIIVGATIQINEATKAADEYTAGTGQIAVYVPRVESVKEGSITKMNLPIIGEAEKQLPNLQLFNFDNELVQEGIQSTRSLGLSDSITACYTLGNRMHSQIEYISNGEIASITGVKEDVPLSNIPFLYNAGTTIRNNKVYSLYNVLRATSVCSGDAADYEMRFIYTSNTTYPTFVFFTDPAPEGAPYMQPKYYLQKENRAFLQCLKGMPWQNTPYSFDRRNGDLLELTTYTRKQHQAQINAAGNIIGGTIGSVASFATGDIGGGLQGSANNLLRTYNDVQNFNNEKLRFEQQRNLVVPEIAFPRDQSIQDYIGNGFYFYRVRISNNDAVRLDNFLTQYGYAVDKKLEKSDFTNRQYFNFVQATNVQLDVERPIRMRNLAKAEISNGVRLWHVAPNVAATTYNPIRTGG